MKIEVTHVIKADPQLISLFGAVLSALGTQSENLSVPDAVNLTSNTVSSEKEESTKATKRTYLFHAESGAVIVVNKGEELASHFEQGLDEITKAEYDRIQAEKQARIDKAKEINYTGTKCSVCNEPQYETPSGDNCKNGHGGATPAVEVQEDAEQTSKAEDHGITIEMVRAEATKLTSNGRQADFKAILTSFNAPKLPEVPEAKYPDLLAAIKEAVGEA